MKIRVDKEGKKRIEELCDAALRHAGMSALAGVVNTLQGMEVLSDSSNRLNDDGRPCSCGSGEAVDRKV